MGKYRSVGFELKCDGNFTKLEFLTHLGTLTNLELHKRHPPRFFTGKFVSPWLYGRIVTRKGDEVFETVEKATLKTKRGKLAEGIEFGSTNYLVINLKSMAGLYTHLKGSCPLTDFGRFCYVQSKIATKVARSADYNKAKAKGKVTPVDRRAITARHTVLCVPLIRKENVSHIVNKWLKINALKYSLSTRVKELPGAVALSPYSKREEISVILDAEKTEGAQQKNSFVKALLEAKEEIGNLIGKSARTRLVGVNQFGSSQTLLLDDLTDVYSEIDEDLLYQDSEVTGTNVGQSTTIKTLIATANNNPKYFIKEVKP